MRGEDWFALVVLSVAAVCFVVGVLLVLELLVRWFPYRVRRVK